jgi:hypothetical protein
MSHEESGTPKNNWEPKKSLRAKKKMGVKNKYGSKKNWGTKKKVGEQIFFLGNVFWGSIKDTVGQKQKQEQIQNCKQRKGGLVGGSCSASSVSPRYTHC